MWAFILCLWSLTRYFGGSFLKKKPGNNFCWPYQYIFVSFYFIHLLFSLVSFPYISCVYYVFPFSLIPLNAQIVYIQFFMFSVIFWLSVFWRYCTSRFLHRMSFLKDHTHTGHDFIETMPIYTYISSTYESTWFLVPHHF